MQLATIFLTVVHAIGPAAPVAPGPGRAKLLTSKAGPRAVSSRVAETTSPVMLMRPVDRERLARYVCALPHLFRGLRDKRRVSTGIVRIGVLGDEGFASYLRSFAAMSVSGRAVRVYDFEDVDHLPRTLNLLFVADVTRFERVPLDRKPLLVVGVDPGFAALGTVELRTSTKRYDVILNVERLERRGLRARSSLLRHAKLYRRMRMRRERRRS